MQGGNQILEIMKREFSMEYLKDNYEKIGISYFDFDSFEVWVNCNFDFNKTTKRCNELNEQIKYNRYSFGKTSINRIVNTLYCKINIEPILNKKGEIVDHYSFLEYKVIDVMDTEYKVIFSKINIRNFSTIIPPNYLRKKLEKVMVFKNGENGWYKVNDKFAREYKESLKVMEKLSVC